MSKRSGLVVDRLHKRFGKVSAADGISLGVARGAMVGFLGPNGAGKTTTMRAIVGMVAPDSGSITWNGAPMTHAAIQRVGYMPQERGLYPKMKVRAQLIYLSRLAGLDADTAGRRADEWLERLDLSDRADSAVSDLSGGNQSRVQLAAALVHEPDLLILDEPFAGLDPVATVNLRSIIGEQAERGTAVLFSSHQLELVSKLCEQVVIVNRGRTLADGRIDDLRNASPRRRLRIGWDHRPAGWAPPMGTIIESDTKSVEIDLPADTDMASALAMAADGTNPTEVSFQAPGLEALFAELVTDAEEARRQGFSPARAASVYGESAGATDS